MADQVHPRDSPLSTSSQDTLSRPSNPPSDKSAPLSGTYVVQLPKDQIYRYPPPENAGRQKKLARRKPRRSPCCRCLCWTFSLLVVLLLLLAATAGILYLVFRPEAPDYSVDRISIRGFNLTSPSAISPEFDVTVRANNPNDKIGIYYEKGSSVVVRYADVELCDGALPVFYQPSNNLTLFRTPLRGSDVLLSRSLQSSLLAEQRQGKVPFKLSLRAPVRLKVGAVKTWTITVKVRCDMTVNNLTASSNIVSKDCNYSVKLWED